MSARNAALLARPFPHRAEDFDGVGGRFEAYSFAFTSGLRMSW